MSACVFVLFRGGQDMWPRAVTMPETEPGLRSSHTSTKTNSRASRHTHVRRTLFMPSFPGSHLLDPSDLFYKRVPFHLMQISSTCWTTMRRPQVYRRRWRQRSFKRTGSLSIPSWRLMSWRCSSCERESHLLNRPIMNKQTTHWYCTAAVYTAGYLLICRQTLVRIWHLYEVDSWKIRHQPLYTAVYSCPPLLFSTLWHIL